MAESRQALTAAQILDLWQPTWGVPMHLAPDGRRLALSVRRKRRDAPAGGMRPFLGDGLPRDMLGSRVLVADTVTGDTIQPFGSGSTSWGGQWSPEGDTLAAYVYRDGPPCLATWSRATGAVRLFRQAPARVFFGYELPRWTPDGRSVIAKLRSEGDTFEYGERTLNPVDGAPGGVRVFSHDADEEEDPERSISWADILGGDLCRVDVATGEITRLAEDWVCASWSLAPDGHALAALRAIEVDEPRDQTYFDLIVAPLVGGEPLVAASRVPQAYRRGFAWSPDSRHIACLAHEDGQPDRLLLVASDGSSEPEDLAAGEDAALVHGHNVPLSSADGGSVYCLAGDGVRGFAADGSGRRVLSGVPDREVVGLVHRPTGVALPSVGGDALLDIVRNTDTLNEGLARLGTAPGEATVLTEFPKACGCSRGSTST